MRAPRDFLPNPSGALAVHDRIVLLGAGSIAESFAVLRDSDGTTRPGVRTAGPTGRVEIGTGIFHGRLRPLFRIAAQQIRLPGLPPARAHDVQNMVFALAWGTPRLCATAEI